MPPPSSPNTLHTWNFYRSGGFDQVRLDTIDDLLNLDQLDQKLWVALSCPSKGLHFDPRTLAALDQDNDGYIRAHELIASLQWTACLLNTPALLAAGADHLPLAAINSGTPEGARILAAAKQILAGLGKADCDSISCADTENSAAAFAALPLNGDAVVTPKSTNHPLLREAISTILNKIGDTPDRSGDKGINAELAAQFFSAGRALMAWRQQPNLEPANSSLLPLKENTATGVEALLKVREKIEDYFTRCRLASFDPRAAELLNASTEDLKSLAPLNLAHTMGSRGTAENNAAISALPLAMVAAGKSLPLTRDSLNPAWADLISSFNQQLVLPLIGARDCLTEQEWQLIMSRFEACLAWLEQKPATALDDLSSVELEPLLAPTLEAALSELIAADAALIETVDAIAHTDRLVRYTRDLACLARNFASFQNFYSGTEKGLFQAGTLYLDGRSCDLCIQVLDPSKHVALASLSGIYLAYCECVRGEKGSMEQMTIAAAFTAGDSDQLMVGRNGLFYDRHGRDWHATITKIIDHPISLRQAFWSPYKKLARLINEQIQKLAASKEKLSEGAASASVNVLTSKASAAVTLPPAKAPASAPTAPAAPFDVAKFAGIFAAIGLAVGAMGTAVANLLHSFLNLAWWQMPLAIAGLLLVVSGPSVLLALFKLRNRNLGPLLDANGWAVNTRARINIPFGRSLTKLATLPAGAKCSNHDPYAETQIPWRRYLLMGSVILGAVTYLKYF